MKVVNFLIYQNLTGELGGLYYSDVPGDNSGEYVSLAEYQELERMIALDTTLQVELGKLRTLLKRWNEIATTVFNIFNGNAHWKSDDLTQLIQDTKETLS